MMLNFLSTLFWYWNKKSRFFIPYKAGFANPAYKTKESQEAH
jgi:hypothetical protein